jgi:hypothetical protein
MRKVPLEDALKLVYLNAEKESPTRSDVGVHFKRRGSMCRLSAFYGTLGRARAS